ncbi:hypothetical protein BC936DRAFT_147137 [Jimgerdemannia flammicorona]|uniref:Uncharacterized protein n=2 Tax=Jimgerdemannia flammicorona TaxID=994334 RepID=A0A433D639_9FUNG|nr:hypothetical protein BC936DRAFT_147137 [Jimgerdemannia flammicorona]RUS31723.1 hypothetical protein BC938DRAFT_477224 [Jimgerdemannia flammicorona]
MVCDYVSGPIGWQGRPGQMLRQSTLLFFKALGPMVIPIMGIDAREYDDITAHVLDDFRRCKSYSNANYAYGRKPLRQ